MGRCIEVWADPRAETPSWSAARRWSDARCAWLQERGLASAQGHIDWHATNAQHGRALLDHAAWSVDFLDATGRAEDVTERLARAGVTRADLPALEEAARRRLAPR